MNKKQREEIHRRMTKWREECEKIIADSDLVYKEKENERNGKTEDNNRAD